jgi:hypothetical protein
MIRRPRRNTPAAVVALVLLAVCVLTVISVVQALLGQDPLIGLSGLLGATSGQTWNGAVTVAVAIVVAVVGLVLLLAAIRPGTPTVLPLVDHIGGQPATDAGVRRHSLATDLSAAAGSVPGISEVRVSAHRRTVTARVTVAAADPAAVPEQVRERLEGRLGEIGPSPCPRVRVRTRRDKNS